MNYDVKDSGNPIYEHLFPFYSDYCLRIIGYKLKTLCTNQARLPLLMYLQNLKTKVGNHQAIICFHKIITNKPLVNLNLHIHRC